MEQEKKLWFRAKSNQDDLIARPKQLWFRAKCFGWGWTPTSWQGWIVMILYSFSVAYIFARAYVNTLNFSNFLIWFLPSFLILTLVLLFICYTKGEKPGWHWGNIDKKPHP